MTERLKGFKKNLSEIHQIHNPSTLGEDVFLLTGSLFFFHLDLFKAIFSFFYRGKSGLNHHLEPQTTIYEWLFGETTIFYVMIWNHPIETSIYKWSFGVPGSWENNFFPFSKHPKSRRSEFARKIQVSKNPRHQIGINEFPGGGFNFQPFFMFTPTLGNDPI